MRALSLLLLSSLALLGGCTRYVQKADYRPAAEVPYDAAPAPIIFNDVELILPVGTDVGFESNGARFCGWPRYPVGRSALRDALDQKFLRQTFHDVMEAQGYDVVGSLDLAYDMQEEKERAEYSVTAKVRAVELEMCHKEPDNILIFFTTRGGTEGEMHLNVDWTVYDALRRTVVYKTTTEGYTERRIPNQEGLALMFTDAFEMAAHNLGADRNVYDLLVSGIKPEGWRKEKIGQSEEAREVQRPRIFDPREEVTVASALSRDSFTAGIDRKRKAAVTIEKFGNASGVFITKEGHILTSALKVGDSLRTRIITADNEHKLVAEVLRVDKTRNVALLKLEEIPEGLEIVTLPVRTALPEVGETVYAVTSPVKDMRKMRDTVTKGIISAYREKMRVSGVQLNFLQSDVEVQTGSTGGPLLDENGNIVGLAEGLYLGPEESGIGLNFFIPIGEALAALDIQTAGGD